MSIGAAQNDVRIFMDVCGQTTADTLQRDFNTSDVAQLYLKLVREEFKELEEGFKDNDVVAVADGIGDLIWVALGLALTLGIPMSPVWEEIRVSNMSKSVDGKVMRRDDGKILKPDTYFPPNIKKALSL
jgi:predicted HAD superfamily Cof-like phosphohydrolase